MFSRTPTPLFRTPLFSALICMAAVSAALAQSKPFGGPTPSPAGATVFFIDLKDGATLPARAKIRFGLRGMELSPAAVDRANSGHHHLLIDADLPPLNEPIPNDFNHLHFGNAQTEAEITLSPGEHTLQLLLGDHNHIPHSPPVMSDRIHVRVQDGPPSLTATSAPVQAAPAPSEAMQTAQATPAPAAPATLAPTSSGRRHASGADAREYFISPTDGDQVSTTFIVRFGLANMGVAPAGVEKPNTGHHHLMIDASLPPLDEPVPVDFNHLHFGAGQTETQITLPPGEHTLQLLLADDNHMPHEPPIYSKPIKITVSSSASASSERSERRAEASERRAEPVRMHQRRRKHWVFYE